MKTFAYLVLVLWLLFALLLVWLGRSWSTETTKDPGSPAAVYVNLPRVQELEKRVERIDKIATACYQREESLRWALQVFAKTAPWRHRLPTHLKAWVEADLGTDLPENP